MRIVINTKCTDNKNQMMQLDQKLRIKINYKFALKIALKTVPIYYNLTV